jgi:uncharacterized phiE125 gp8 family phage protein
MDLDTTKALISLQEAKEYLGIDNATTTQDAILSALLNGIGEWVSKFLGRNLVQATYTEYYDGDGADELMLKNVPIVSVTSVYVDALRAFGSDTLIASSNYIVKKAVGILKAWQLFGFWTHGDANIKVTYVAGYTTSFSGGTMPHNIRLAVKRILERQYLHGFTHRKLDVASETIGDATTTFREDRIPKDAIAMLEPHRAFMDAPRFAYAD